MTKIIRKKTIAAILTLAVMISFIPVTAMTAEAADITPGENPDGPGTGEAPFEIASTAENTSPAGSGLTVTYTEDVSLSSGEPAIKLAGSGIKEDPFEIASVVDFVYMRNQVNTGGTIMPREGGTAVDAGTAYYKLTADIVLGYWQDADHDGIVDEGEIYDSETGGTAYAESNWEPIGNYDYSFKGTFDGNGHTVTEYIKNDTEEYLGLFGYVENGTIKNLGVNSTAGTAAPQVSGTLLPDFIRGLQDMSMKVPIIEWTKRMRLLFQFLPFSLQRRIRQQELSRTSQQA